MLIELMCYYFEFKIITHSIARRYDNKHPITTTCSLKNLHSK